VFVVQRVVSAEQSCGDCEIFLTSNSFKISLGHSCFIESVARLVSPFSEAQLVPNRESYTFGAIGSNDGLAAKLFDARSQPCF